MLELRGVVKRYSGIAVVNDVSFTARAGEVTGYLGPNGSGKSTTLKMITGLIEPSEGEILYRGVPIERDLIAHKMRLGYVPEEPHLYQHLTGEEFLEMTGDLRGLPRKPLAAKIAGLLRAFSLYGDRFVPISSYSKGMRQKILLAAALLHNPGIILLDEPFSGLDVGSALVLRNLIQELAKRGKTILFSTHELDVVERVCSRVVILHKGRVVASDSIERLRNLMALPTLEEIFAQLAIEINPAAITGEIVECMELSRMLARRQFNVLYRTFLLRIVDLEVLPAHGDPGRLLAQIATLLAALSFMLAYLILPPYASHSAESIALPQVRHATVDSEIFWTCGEGK